MNEELPRFLVKQIERRTNQILQARNMRRRERVKGWHVSDTMMCPRRVIAGRIYNDFLMDDLNPPHPPISIGLMLCKANAYNERQQGFFEQGFEVQRKLEKFLGDLILFSSADGTPSDSPLRVTIQPDSSKSIWLSGEVDIVVVTPDSPKNKVLIECKGVSRKDADRMEMINRRLGTIGEPVQYTEPKFHHIQQVLLYLKALLYRDLSFLDTAWICYWCREDSRKFWAPVSISQEGQYWPGIQAYWMDLQNLWEKFIQEGTLPPNEPTFKWECRWGKSGFDTCEYYRFCFEKEKSFYAGDE